MLLIQLLLLGDHVIAHACVYEEKEVRHAVRVAVAEAGFGLQYVLCFTSSSVHHIALNRTIEAGSLGGKNCNT